MQLRGKSMLELMVLTPRYALIRELNRELGRFASVLSYHGRVLGRARAGYIIVYS